MTEPALVGRRRSLLLGMGGDQGGIEVDDVEAGVGSRGPHLLAGTRSGHRDPLECFGVDGLEGPPRRRRRGHLPEQIGLITEHRKVRDGVAAVGDHHGQIDEDLAAVMAPLALLRRGHRRR